MEAKIYLSAEGQCSVVKTADAVEVRTAFLGKGIVADAATGRIADAAGTEYKLTFEGGAIKIAGGGPPRSVHVSNIERLPS